MKKFLFALAVLGGTTLSSIAQTSATSSTPKNVGKFSIGLDGGLPLGDASTAFSAIIGGSLKFEYPTAPNIYFTISAGYSAYLTKSILKDVGVQSSFGFVPLKAGIKYHTGTGLFLEGQSGIVFSTERGGSKAFVYSPGVGYTFTSGFEIGVRYEGWVKDGTTSQISLRLAARF